MVEAKRELTIEELEVVSGGCGGKDPKNCNCQCHQEPQPAKRWQDLEG